MGVLQELQDARGLLFGPTTAQYLSVVSGGSYIGATLILNAAALSKAAATEAEPAPLAAGSPEAEHVLGHGRYLVEHGTIATGARFAALGTLNMAALFVMFLWAGTMLADVALIARWSNLRIARPPTDELSWLLWPVALAAILGGVLILRGLFRDGGITRYVLPVLGGGILFVTSASLVNRMASLAPLSTPNWWLGLKAWWIIILLVAGAVLATATLVGFLPRRGGLIWVVSRVLNMLAMSIPRAIGIVLLSFGASAMYSTLLVGTAEDASTREGTVGMIAFFSTLALGVAFSAVPNRASLHRTYRHLLALCFGVRRQDETVERVSPTTAITLSELAPPASANSFPRLLICATANVRWRDPAGRRKTFAPFVMSHDRCGIPGVDNAWFDTTQLELIRVPAGFRRRTPEPAISLMSAIATTGAAISPSMGKMTVPAFRPFLAAFNLRLGRWLPNPLSRRTRARVEGLTEPGALERDARLGGGFNDLVQEMFGLHTADGPRVYVSDGGHYDNLGLLALLRARCEEIWCIDSQADKRGMAAGLRQVILLAEDELGVQIELDVDRFAGADGVLGNSFAVGTIDYGGGQSGRLVVVKLGLNAESSEYLFDYKKTDARYPYHPTWRQVYSRPRVDAYRRLGIENARLALAAVADQWGQ